MLRREGLDRRSCPCAGNVARAGEKVAEAAKACELGKIAGQGLVLALYANRAAEKAKEIAAEVERGGKPTPRDVINAATGGFSEEWLGGVGIIGILP